MCFWLVSSSFYDQKICDGWSLAAMFNGVTSNKTKNNNNKKNKTKKLHIETRRQKDRSLDFC